MMFTQISIMNHGLKCTVQVVLQELRICGLGLAAGSGAEAQDQEKW